MCGRVVSLCLSRPHKARPSGGKGGESLDVREEKQAEAECLLTGLDAGAGKSVASPTEGTEWGRYGIPSSDEINGYYAFRRTGGVCRRTRRLGR